MDNKPHEHDWGKTERKDSGVIFKAHACRKCKLIKAYDMKVVSPAAFKGRYELEERR